MRDSIKESIKKFRDTYHLPSDQEYCYGSTHLDNEICCNILGNISDINEHIECLKSLGENSMITSPVDRDDAFEADITNHAWMCDL